MDRLQTTSTQRKQYLGLILGLLFCLSACNDTHEKAEGMTLERVIAGDTFIANGRRIRLWGIDAPDQNDPHAYAAIMYLETILEEGPFTCEEQYEDSFKRLLMKCFSDGSDVASFLVLMGMATDYKKHSNGYYDFEEQEAKKYNRGIWKISTF